LMVFDAFNWTAPTYAHMTLIVNDEGKKLSKRDADTVQFIEQYANMGYLPEGLFNFISLLGHSPDSESEVLSMDEIIHTFDVKRLSKSPSTFDRAKLAFINTQYIKELDSEELLELCMPHLIDADILTAKSTDWALELVNLFHDRLTYGGEIADLYDEFFSEDFILSKEAKDFMATISETGAGTLQAFKDELGLLEEFSPEEIKGAIKQAGKSSEVKGKNLFMPCRIGVSGQMHGPDLPMMVTLLGREVALERLDVVIKELEGGS